VAHLLPPEVKVLSMADKPLESFWSYKVNTLQHRLGRPTATSASKHIWPIAAAIPYPVVVAMLPLIACAPVTQRSGIPVVITEHGSTAISA
jgi:hypothetical protein